jgi:hypothetical protein
MIRINGRYRSWSSLCTSFRGKGIAAVRNTIQPKAAAKIINKLRRGGAASAACGSACANGTIYIAWEDGRNNPQFDVLAGTYNFGDIVLVKSTDGGTSWTSPKMVSPTPADFTGVGRDQFQPAVAVNRDGVLAVCYYDRRNDPLNNAVDHFCSISKDHGRSFHDSRQTAQSWAPIHDTDLFASDPRALGFYDTVAPHLSSEKDDAFFTSFQVIKNAAPGVHGRRVSSEQ